MSAAARSPSLQDADDARTVVFQEALHLDAQRWDDWLDLYRPDAVFWLPAWTDEHRLGESPDRELSLIYCTARAGLEDRVWRVRSGLSVASLPLPRTAHAVTNSVVTAGADDRTLQVESTFTCHLWQLKDRRQQVFFGRYEHLLAHDDGRWRIARKKVVLMNDLIPTMLDFYCV